MADSVIEKRNQFLAEVAEIDSEIMKLKDLMLEKMQKAVDLELQSLGDVSQMTQKFLEAFQYSMEDKTVIETEKIVKIEVKEKEVFKAKRSINQEEFNKLLLVHQNKQRQGVYEILDLSNCLFEEITFTGEFKDVLFKKCDFMRCNFDNVQMENVSFSKSDFIDGKMLSSDFNNCNFYNAGINFSFFSNSMFKNCSFETTAFASGTVEKNSFYKCTFLEASIHATKFNDNLIQDCEGMESIDLSNNNAEYQKEFKINPFSHNNVRHEFVIANADFINQDFKIILRTYQNEEKVFESDFNINYDMETHKLSDSVLSDAGMDEVRDAWSFQKPEIEKQLQKLEFENKAIITNPKIMVRKSDALRFQDNTIYDLKDFSDKLMSDIKSNGSQNIEYILVFDYDKQHYQYKGIYESDFEKVGFIEHLKGSVFFNNAQIKYLENYINTPKMKYQQISADSKQDLTKQNVINQYRGYAYIKGNGEKQRPLMITGGSREEILIKLQNMNQERPEDNQLLICYMKMFNKETGKFEAEGKYDIKTGLDISPIYLELPHTRNREKWNNTVATLKEHGAKYNPELKKFYITKQQDLNFFADYIPKDMYASLKSSEAHTAMKSQSDNKDSIINKLNENKGKMSSEPLPQNEQKNIDTPVL